MVFVEPIIEIDTELLQSEESSISPERFLSDEQILRCIKALAARRGVDRQSVMRAWVKGCLEVEFRKMVV